MFWTIDKRSYGRDVWEQKDSKENHFGIHHEDGNWVRLTVGYRVYVQENSNKINLYVGFLGTIFI